MRRSLFSSEIIALPENDDNLEQSRRLSVASPNVRNRQRMSTDGSKVLGSDMIVHFTQCLKLSSENKINPGNAFQLEMIDYMISMLSAKDSKMDNFQIASFTLDASTKIYASRVDKVHSDGIKIASELLKTAVRKEKCAAAGAGDSSDECKTGNKAGQRANRRVRKIIMEPESLNAPLQQNYKLHPSLLFMNTMFSDCRPGCVNLMPRISVVGDTQKLQFLCAESAVGSCEVSMQDQNAEVPMLPDLTKLKITTHKIEPADFLDDDLASGLSQCAISEGLDMSTVTEKLKLDLQLENNFEDDPCQGSVIETLEDDGDDREPSNSPESSNFDIRSHLSSKPQEYSYFNTEKLSLWRGPSHWKIFSSKAKIEDTVKVKRKQRPKKKVKELFAEGFEHNVDDKMQKGGLQRLAKGTTQKWQETKVTSQLDVHYEPNQFRSLFLNANFLLKFKNERNMPMSVEDVVDDSDAVKYDYCNPNDTLEYCPNVPDTDESSSEEGEGGHELKEANSIAVTSTRDERESTCQWKLLTPPTVATKISIPFAKESKKVDMAKLKTTMWSILKKLSACSPAEKNKIKEIVGVLNKPEGTVTQFSKLFSETKAAWPDDTKAELSFAILFQALLHLTNEKKMHLKSNDDLSDAIIFCPKSSSNI